MSSKSECFRKRFQENLHTPHIGTCNASFALFLVYFRTDTSQPQLEEVVGGWVGVCVWRQEGRGEGGRRVRWTYSPFPPSRETAEFTFEFVRDTFFVFRFSVFVFRFFFLLSVLIFCFIFQKQKPKTKNTVGGLIILLLKFFGNFVNHFGNVLFGKTTNKKLNFVFLPLSVAWRVQISFSCSCVFFLVSLFSFLFFEKKFFAFFYMFSISIKISSFWQTLHQRRSESPRRGRTNHHPRERGDEPLPKARGCTPTEGEEGQPPPEGEERCRSPLSVFSCQFVVFLDTTNEKTEKNKK